MPAKNPKGMKKLREAKQYHLRLLAEVALINGDTQVAADLRQADADINKMLRLLARTRDAFRMPEDSFTAEQAGILYDITEFLAAFLERKD